MRRLTLGALLLAATAMVLAGCEKGGGESTGSGAAAQGGGQQAQGGGQQAQGGGQQAQGTGQQAQAGGQQGTPRETYYEEAERGLPPQERVQRDLRGLFDQTLAYYDAHQAVPASAPLTPATVPCGQPAALNAADWQTPTWRALRFTPRDPHYYSYQYDSAPIMGHAGYGDQTEVVGGTFTITAYGDLNCNGVRSTFVRAGTVRGGVGGTSVNGDTEARITNRDE